LVFQNTELGSFFNNEFIAFRVTPSDETWKEMRAKFEIRGTPTVVLLKSDGEELDRINGFSGTDEFIGSVKEYLAGNNLLSTFIAQVEQNPDDAKANFELGKKYSSRWEDEKAYPYYAKTVELDPDDTMGFNTESKLRIAQHMIGSQENPDPAPLLKFIAENTNEDFMIESYSSLARYYQYAKETDKIMPLWEELLAKMPDSPAVMNEYAYNVFSLEDESLYDKAKDQAERALASGDEDQLFMSHYNIIRYYRLMEDNETAVAMYERAAQNVPDEAFFKYGYAAVVLQEKMADKYDRAIEMIKAAIEMNEGNGNYWDTLAGLQFEDGNREEAVKAQEKAVELMPDNEEFQKKLDKYREQKP